MGPVKVVRSRSLSVAAAQPYRFLLEDENLAADRQFMKALPCRTKPTRDHAARVLARPWIPCRLWPSEVEPLENGAIVLVRLEECSQEVVLAPVQVVR